MEKSETSRIGAFYTLLHDLVYILVAICLLFVFVVRFVTVSGPSMQPTLQEKDAIVLLSNFLCSDYKSGDVVVATVPTFDDARPIVKRVIATEGQVVYINFETGVVLVDGEMIDEPYIAEPTYLDYDDGLSYPVTVPEGCVFLMGDNRNDSADSRYAPIGCVDTRYILGKVILRALPLRGFGTVK